MQLERAIFPVSTIRLGGVTRWQDGVLDIDTAELTERLLRDPSVAEVGLAVARPGGQQRIIHVRDAIEPRCKADGPGTVFPGLLGPPETAGQGRTHVLTGMAVITTAEMPWDGVRGPHEAIVDMDGPAATASPFSATWNLVVTLSLAPDRDKPEYQEAVRKAGIRAAAYLAECTRRLEPPQLQRHELTPCPADLPRVVYVHQVMSTGLYGQSYLYGRDMDTLLPTLIHPNELLDGALVNSGHRYACFETPTYLKCNLPVMHRLYRGHGKDHNFAGMILSRGHYHTFADKHRIAHYAAKLARLLHADGAILTWEGGGNSIIEAMLTIQALEQSGIATVAVSYEMGGGDGRDNPLIESVPEARALVSAGSHEKRIHLPAVREVFGGDSLYLDPRRVDQRVPAAGPLELETMHPLFAAGNQTGFGRRQVVDF